MGQPWYVTDQVRAEGDAGVAGLMGWRRGAFSRIKALWMVAALLGAIAPAFAIEPGIADYKHMGVASCATSVCHGKLAPQADKRRGAQRVPDLAAGGPPRASVSHARASRVQTHRRQSRVAQRRPRPRSVSIVMPTTCRPTSAARSFRSAMASAAKAATADRKDGWRATRRRQRSTKITWRAACIRPNSR